MAARTPLYDWHVNRKARIVDFGGWDMPIVYTSIVEEHRAARTAAGLFDISHMGRLRFEGPQTVQFLDHVLTNAVATLKPGQIRYSLALNEDSGILDDVLVYSFDDWHLMVVNASNRLKLLEWFNARIAGFDCTMTDMTADRGMIAVQGPLAVGIVEEFAQRQFSDLKYYFGRESDIAGRPAIVSRTGYTGEDGLELIVPADFTETVWNGLLEIGGSKGILPVALGARDTLRLEAAMPLYGHELSERIDPLQAGLAWAVKSADKDFIGRQPLLRRDPNRPVRVGLRTSERRIAREGFEIWCSGKRVGTITSGTFGPTVQASIAMGYVDPSLASIGTGVQVPVRGEPVPAAVAAMPFYQRKK